MNIPLQVELFRGKLSKIPDLERLLAKVFTYSVKDSTKAVMFENVSYLKLIEFRDLLTHFKDI
jgi:hypothetical protein